jgi:hypothetical protein
MKEAKQFHVLEASAAGEDFRTTLEDMLNLGWELISLKFFNADNGEPWGFAVLRARA